MTANALSRPGRVRAGLLALAAVPALQSAWMLLAPRGFYEAFPGLGRSWLPPVGVYDEHLSRDAGAAMLGMAVVLIAAAVLAERRVVQVALIGFLAATLPHLAYHLTTTGSYPAVDNALSLGGFAAQVGFAVWLLFQTRTRSVSWPASSPSRPPRAVH
jgi:hypothetical protein